MARFLLRRLLWLVPVMLSVSIVTFLLGHLAPGGPFDRDAMQRQMPPETIALLDRQYHLDEPLWAQYLRYMGGALHGDLGPSFQYQGQSVTDLLFRPSPGRPPWESRMGRTAELGGIAFVFAMAVGLPLGVLAALRHNAAADYLARFVATCGVSVPGFVLAVFLLLLFGVQLRWLPVAATDYAAWQAWVLPSVCLGAGLAAFLARLTRASLLEVLRQDYIRTARAKGLGDRSIVVRHALRNSLVPTATVLGPALAGLITGSFFIESVFAFPGAGRMYIQAVGQRDYSVVMGTTLLYAVLISLANLAVDLTYRRLDPRVRLS
jgi:oligopeptide transport system permease protein